MSWLGRALAHRGYFEQIRCTYEPAFGEGTRLVHRWILMLTGGTTVEWAARAYGELDEVMRAGGHDGGSGWAAFRSDFTAWLSTVVLRQSRVDDGPHLARVAACLARYFESLGGRHAVDGAPLCHRWHDALVTGSAAALDSVLTEARAATVLNTLGAGPARLLMESSARAVEGATLLLGPPELHVTPTTRSGTPLPVGSPLRIRLLGRSGGSRLMELPAVFRLTIGRGPDCELQIPDSLLSRRHAHLLPCGGVLGIADAGSANGTFLDERKVEALTPHNHRDPIVIGDYVLIVESG